MTKKHTQQEWTDTMRRVLRGLGGRHTLHHHIKGRDFLSICNGYGLRFRFNMTFATVKANYCEVISEMDALPHYEMRLIYNNPLSCPCDRVAVEAKGLTLPQAKKMLGLFVGKDLNAIIPIRSRVHTRNSTHE